MNKEDNEFLSEVHILGNGLYTYESWHDIQTQAAKGSVMLILVYMTQLYTFMLARSRTASVHFNNVITGVLRPCI